MTMSVGLARIIQDPEASVIVRKALGALSTPGLLVYDTALSIDDTGRIILRLKPDGGLLQDEDGLYMEVTVGIDSHVDLDSDEHDREWNARLTGTAPNFFQGSVAIGTEELGGISASGTELQDAKLQVTSTECQLRLSHDPHNFMAVKVESGGNVGFYSAGSAPGFHFFSGDGTPGSDNPSGGLSINNGTEIEQIIVFEGDVSFAGGGVAGVTSWEEVYSSVTTGANYQLRPGQDLVTVMPKNSIALPTQLLAYTARISSSNSLALRLCWHDVMAADSRTWMFLVHRMKD